MQNKIVAVREGGLTYATLVEKDTPVKDYPSGIRLGPPETITGVKLPVGVLAKLTELLFENKFYSAPDFMNRRTELFAVFQKIGIPAKDHKSLARQIISLYQQDYFGVNTNG